MFFAGLSANNENKIILSFLIAVDSGNNWWSLNQF